MSGEPAAKGDRDRLPFEPKGSRKGKAAAPKDAPESPAPPKPQARPLNPLPPSKKQREAEKAAAETRDRGAPRRYSREEMAIPEVVNRRMVKRMAAFCGIPTGLGFASFIVGYWINVNGIAELPNVAVLLASLGGLGLGVLGLSYGVLSASWEEDEPGSLLGLAEFRTNFGRMRSSWRDAQAARSRNNS